LTPGDVAIVFQGGSACRTSLTIATGGVLGNGGLTTVATIIAKAKAVVTMIFSSRERLVQGFK
jgi:hypothetical protein